MATDAQKNLIKVAKRSDLPEGTMRSFDVNGKRILIANVAGKYYAIGAICKHAEWDLAEGTLDGYKVECLGHGAVWDLRDGTAEFQEDLPREPVYEVLVNGEYILVNPEPISGNE